MQTLKNTTGAKFNGVHPGESINVEDNLVDGYVANGFSYVDEDGNTKRTLNGPTVQQEDELAKYADLTKKMLTTKLDEANIAYSPKATRDELLQLCIDNQLVGQKTDEVDALADTDALDADAGTADGVDGDDLGDLEDELADDAE